MRRLRYQVAASLDGFIAGPNGEYDWIMPVLLGEGIPLVPPGPVIKKLRLVESHALPSRIVMLTYEAGERS